MAATARTSSSPRASRPAGRWSRFRPCDGRGHRRPHRRRGRDPARARRTRCLRLPWRDRTPEDDPFFNDTEKLVVGRRDLVEEWSNTTPFGAYDASACASLGRPAAGLDLHLGQRAAGPGADSPTACSARLHPFDLPDRASAESGSSRDRTRLGPGLPAGTYANVRAALVLRPHRLTPDAGRRAQPRAARRGTRRSLRPAHRRPCGRCPVLADAADVRL